MFIIFIAALAVAYFWCCVIARALFARDEDPTWRKEVKQALGWTGLVIVAGVIQLALSAT